MQSLSNYQWHFFTELEQNFHNMYGNTKDPTQVAKAILKRKNGAGGINLPDFRFYYNYKATVIRWYGTGTKTEI